MKPLPILKFKLSCFFLISILFFISFLANAAWAGWTREPVETLTKFSRSSIAYHNSEIWIAYGDSRLYLAHYNGSWQTETVDQAGDVGSYPSLAVDADGHPHISYCDQSNGRLKYAFYNGTSWAIETVDSGEKDEDVGWWSSLVLDSSGKPHISYYFEGNLRYAYKGSAEWQIQTVDGDDYNGKYTSIALDSEGKPHISYWGEEDLRYARHDGSAWHTETVEIPGSGEAGWDTSIAVDDNGHPHISSSKTAGELWYATHNGSEWVFENICQALIDRSTTIKLDSAGHPHICHGKSYAWHDGSSWTVEDFPPQHWSDDSSMTLDGGDNPHISFYFVNSGVSQYTLYYTKKDGSGWQETPTVIDTHEPPAAYVSMALGPDNYSHMVWSDEHNTIKYAAYNGSLWQTETLMTGSGSQPDIAVDSDGHPHISYNSGATTLYTWHDGSSWQTQTLFNQYVPEYWQTAICVDTNDNPRIVYNDNLDNLIYEWFDGSWHNHIVDTGAHIPRMALNSAGKPHIIYVKYDNGYNLYYSFYDGSNWHSQAVVAGVYVESNMHGHFDIALDSRGLPHLSYIKNCGLRYTWYDGTAWHTEIIDTEQYRYFETPSISIDTNDHPHITYYEISDSNLKYAWHDGSSWNIRIADNDGRAGKSSSLVVDNSGKPHVGYVRYDGLYYTGFDGAWSSPAAPSNLTATPVSSQQIELNWTDNSANEDGFRIEYGEEPGDWQEFATVDSGVTTYNDIIVPSGTTYYFRVRAHNSIGDSGYSNEADAATPAGQVPSGFNASSATLTNTYVAGQKGLFSTYAGYGSISGCSRYIKAVTIQTIDTVECLRLLVKGNGNHPDPDQDPEWASICLAEDTAHNVWLFEFHMVNGDEEQTIMFNKDSALLWMPVNPKEGDILRQFGFNEYDQIVESGVTVQQLNTGQGPYTDCFMLAEAGEDVIKAEYYCPGSGMVREIYQGWGDTYIWEIDQNSLLNPGDVSGTVFEYAGGQATGLEGAVITILETGQTATSGVTGYFSFSGDVIAGTYTIKIEKDDYFATVLNHVVISEGQATQIPSEETTLYPEESYRFERMWPTLQQLWYFYYPKGIATDNFDNVYVASPGVQKYNANGQFITGWKVYKEGETPCYPVGIAADSHGNVYITEPTEDSVRKYDSAGRFITRWGSGGTGNGKFDNAQGIALNNSGDVYVVDSNNYRVQKFSSEGEFITKWGEWGQDNGQFYLPNRIAIDREGYVYVSDWSLHRVQKFGPNGDYITQWGSEGSGDGQFNHIDGIAISDNGDVYVADNGDINDPEDTDNYRIQKFTPVDDGNGGYNYVFDMAWGSKGKRDGEFNYLRDITIDRNGNLYAVDSGLGYEPETVESHRIQKFTLDGQFITTWGSEGDGPGNFFGPTMIAIDGSGNAYVSEQGNDRVQKFSAQGEFLLEWGSEGTGNGQFKDPFGLVIDDDGNIYVADSGNHRIQKFDSQGVYVTEFDGSGSAEGNLDTPVGLAIQTSGTSTYLYVTDWGKNRIQKFTSDGQSQAAWGSVGSGNCQFKYPTGIAIDGSGNIYVSDTGDIHDHDNTDNNRIQKLDSAGTYLTEWGGKGEEDGQFNSPTGMWIDGNGYVYVADAGNNRIQKFGPDGRFLTKFGIPGFNPGELMEPYAVAVSPDNSRAYVTDYRNDRVQVFKKVGDTFNKKAIIVAGGGPYANNDLWDDTQMCANFAYRTLTFQGFTKETIHYLTSDTDLDLDINDEPDDVDGDATLSNLEQAITTWADDADNLVVYLVDHGGNGTFMMSDSEKLTASDLDSWLDTIQGTLPGEVIVVVDACRSGSFLGNLAPDFGKNRVIIASSNSDETANFSSHGSISFSNFFWTHILNGESIYDAYDLGKQALDHYVVTQQPQMDVYADGDLIVNETEDYNWAQTNYIGTGTEIHGDAPVIGDVSGEQTLLSGTTTALLFASGVTDYDKIARVWAVIRPPNYYAGQMDNPVLEFPTKDLMPVGGDQYEATCVGFNIQGTYHIDIYARDRIGNTSVPKSTTVIVENPLRRRAILIAGGTTSDDLWPAVEKNVRLSYQVLTFHGYTDDDIQLLSPAVISGVTKTPVTADLSHLQTAINTCAQQSTQDVVLYMVGKGGSGTFEINGTETLSATDLDAWLDTMQNSIPGKVTVVYDADYSGNFIPYLTPPQDKERILISSTKSNQTAQFLSQGDISFSGFFWRDLLNGKKVRAAFVNAFNSLSNCGAQTPGMDDNGNEIPNEKMDGLVSEYYTIGVGIMLAADAPVIGSNCSGQTIYAVSSADLWTEDITTTETIDKVWAVISPPGYPGIGYGMLLTVEMEINGSGRYEGTCSGVSNYGMYEVAIYAMDTDESVSVPNETWIFRTDGPDIFEDDDTFNDANVIILNHADAQTHNFHDNGDQDWVKFYGIAGESYEIKTENCDTMCDTVITLYDESGTTEIATRDFWRYGGNELLSWQCPSDGIYFVMVKQYTDTDYGQNTGYDLRVYQTVAPFSGFIEGIVIDALSGNHVGDVRIRTNDNNSTVSWPDSGAYLMIHPAGGPFTLTAEAAGYLTFTDSVSVEELGIVTMNIIMVPEKGDINGDGVLTQADADLALQVLAGKNPGGIRSDYASSGADVNGDGRIGMEEVIYIKENLEGVRN
jgi:streptogramin lyase